MTVRLCYVYAGPGTPPNGDVVAVLSDEQIAEQVLAFGAGRVHSFIAEYVCSRCGTIDAGGFPCDHDPGYCADGNIGAIVELFARCIDECSCA